MRKIAETRNPGQTRVVGGFNHLHAAAGAFNNDTQIARAARRSTRRNQHGADETQENLEGGMEKFSAHRFCPRAVPAPTSLLLARSGNSSTAASAFPAGREESLHAT